MHVTLMFCLNNSDVFIILFCVYNTSTVLELQLLQGLNRSTMLYTERQQLRCPSLSVRSLTQPSSPC